MKRAFPADREKMRKALLDAVQEVRDVLVAGADCYVISSLRRKIVPGPCGGTGAPGGGPAKS